MSALSLRLDIHPAPRRNISRDSAPSAATAHHQKPVPQCGHQTTVTLIRHFGLTAVGGKGGLDAGCVQAMQEVGCVYLSFFGGGAPLHSAAIEAVREVAYSDLVAHYRLVRLAVRGLGPLTVGIDAHGNSLFDTLQDQAQNRLPAADHTSRLATFSALPTIKSRRGSTRSPISVEKTCSASSTSSTRTRSSVRAAGSSVVFHS